MYAMHAMISMLSLQLRFDLPRPPLSRHRRESEDAISTAPAASRSAIGNLPRLRLFMAGIPSRSVDTEDILSLMAEEPEADFSGAMGIACRPVPQGGPVMRCADSASCRYRNNFV